MQYRARQSCEQDDDDTLSQANSAPLVGLADVVQQSRCQDIDIAAARRDEPPMDFQKVCPIRGRESPNQPPLLSREERLESGIDLSHRARQQMTQPLPDAVASAARSACPPSRADWRRCPRWFGR